VRSIIDRCSLFGYGEIKEEVYSRWSTSSLMSALSEVDSPAFVGITIKSKEDVYPALRKFFAQQPASA